MAAEENITGFELEDPLNEIAAAWHVGAFVDDIKVSLTLRELSHRLSLWKHSAKPVRCGRTSFTSLVVLSTC